MKVEAHTLRFGKPDWMPLCAHSLDDWCSRHGASLKIWDESNINPLYPAAKFCEVDMLRDFVASDNDWLIYMDSDVWIDKTAPLPDLSEPGFHICPDRPCKWITNWPLWCRLTYPDNGHIAQGFTYCNAGIWYCDKKSAEQFLKVVSEPYHDRCQEQDQFNWWLALAEKEEGLKIVHLDPIWNRFPKEFEKSFAYHIAGTNKMDRMETLAKKGFIPFPPEPFVAPELGTHERAVVIPWKQSKAMWHELRFALRSIIENFADKDCPIFILGDAPPTWWIERESPRIKFIQTWLYEEAVTTGLTLAKKILWTNDDIVFLKPCDWEDFELARHLNEETFELGKQYYQNSESWRKGYGRAIMSLALVHPGRKLLNYSTHTPYVFEREKGLEVLRLYGLYHKIPLETLYHNHWQTESGPLGTMKTLSLPSDSLILNHSDALLTPDLMDELTKMFPVRPKWELPM